MWARLRTNWGRKKNSNGETRLRLSLTGGYAVSEVIGDTLLPRPRGAESSGLAAGARGGRWGRGGARAPAARGVAGRGGAQAPTDPPRAWAK